jgi:hypothetical protein
LPHLKLDSIAHQPFFEPTPLDQFRAKVGAFLSENTHGWVIDGNYSNKVTDMTWDAATDIVWLDYPIYIVLWRLFLRTLWRIVTGVKLWDMDGCVETWRAQFFSRKSLLYGVLFSVSNFVSLGVIWFYRVRKPEFYNDLIGKGEKGPYEGKNIIWLQAPRQANELLKDLTTKG